MSPNSVGPLQCCVCRATVGEFFIQSTPGGEARRADGTRIVGSILEMVCRDHLLGPTFVRAGVRSPPEPRGVTITMGMER